MTLYILIAHTLPANLNFVNKIWLDQLDMPFFLCLSFSFHMIFFCFPFIFENKGTREQKINNEIIMKVIFGLPQNDYRKEQQKWERQWITEEE